ncbi:Trafficking protein particle complex subunit 10 [Trichoplax sp. H2]|nr:Trafficking protein particle complex subunit 10 [Trichoplax sp. H2]|eukprot:RDD37411.1 Trafficking protein particle complex subunit 10 [Trichoplax sp. H2]
MRYFGFLITLQTLANYSNVYRSSMYYTCYNIIGSSTFQGLGDRELYTLLYGHLCSRLPNEEIEFQRSLNFPPKYVTINVDFAVFDENLLKIEDESKYSLYKVPFFHIYVTDCADLDTYKTKHKLQISEWLRTLKNYDVNDWCIILITSADGSRMKSKLNLTKSSVYDKIRNDFNITKQQDRCFQLVDPTSKMPRSLESWTYLTNRLRRLLLISFSAHLIQFEEKLRLIRNKRNDANWNYCTYFRLQEELAIVYELMGLDDECLIQYRELDALLSEFISDAINKNSIKWFNNLENQYKSWNGVLWHYDKDFKAQLMSSRNVTFLDFRNYIFSRQSNLLIRLNQPATAAESLLNFMSTCSYELEVLKTTLSPGAHACWVFLSSMTLLHKIESKFMINGSILVHTCNLWACSRSKLLVLGELCGLIPKMTQQSEHLQCACELLSGITVESNEPNSPYSKLRNALNSKSEFQKYYIELCCKTLENFKHVGRLRRARQIGKELANFYIQCEMYDRAEVLLREAFDTYVIEGWKKLAEDVLLILAECEKYLQEEKQYLYQVEQKRLEYSSHLEHSIDGIDEEMCFPMMPLLEVKTIKLMSDHADKISLGSIRVCVDVFNHSSKEIKCNALSLAIKRQNNDSEELHRSVPTSSLSALHYKVSLHSSGSDFSVDMFNFLRVSDENLNNSESSSLDATASDQDAKKTRQIIQMLDTEHNSNSIIKPYDSDFKHLVCDQAILRPGLNSVIVTGEIGKDGEYQVRSFSLNINKKMTLVHPRVEDDKFSFNVIFIPPRIDISSHGQLSELFIAGAKQNANVKLINGSTAISSGSQLKLCSSTGLKFIPKPSYSAKKRLHDQPIDESVVVDLDINSKEMQDSFEILVTLPACESYAEISFDLEFLAHQALSIVSCRTQTDRKPADKDPLLFLRCLWLPPTYSCIITLIFYEPFILKQKLQLTGIRNFVHIILQAVLPTIINIKEASLKANSIASGGDNATLINLIPVKKSGNIKLHPNQTLSLLWQVAYNNNDTESLELSNEKLQQICTLLVDYSMVDEKSEANRNVEPFQFIYRLSLANVQMLYTINSFIHPDTNCDSIVVGLPCNLQIEIKDARKKHANDNSTINSESPIDHYHLLYSIQVNTSSWIVCGRNCGIVTIPQVPGATVSVSVMVVPLVSGNLPMPFVKLCKYNPNYIQYLRQKSTHSESLEKSVSNQGLTTTETVNAVQPDPKLSSSLTPNSSFLSIQEMIEASGSENNDARIAESSNPRNKLTAHNSLNEINLSSSEEFEFYPLSDHRTVLVDSVSSRESIEPEASSKLKSSISYSGLNYVERQKQHLQRQASSNIPELANNTIVRSFKPGEVCNCSRACQIRVLPSSVADPLCYTISVVDATSNQS